MNAARPRFPTRNLRPAETAYLGRVALGLLLSVVSFPALCDAHPMGNFSISHYAGIRIEGDFIELRYLVDMAEIPTFQEIQEMQKVGIVLKPGDPSLASYLEREARILKAGLTLEVDGQPLPLNVISKDVIFPPGAGGLPTMKLGFVYRAPLGGLSADSANRFEYRDRNFPERAGWKEVIAVEGQGVEFVSSSAPNRDRSQQLSNYPTDLLNSPPQVLDAEVRFTRTAHDPLSLTGSGLSNRLRPEARKPKAEGAAKQAASPAPSLPTQDRASDADDPKPPTRTPSLESFRVQGNQQATPRNRFTELIATRRFGFWFLLTAALIAAGLGAFHALEPGHGKTIVAAYLVGSGGTAAHACLLGLIVTASHTAGVYVLGAVTLYASRYVVPDRLYPWLGVLSGLVIAGLGVVMFLRRYAGSTHGHSHSHGHDHSHGLELGHSHEHQHSHESDHHHHHHDHHHHEHVHAHHHHHHPLEPGRKVSYRQLLALGVTGGMVPCPAALVVLLSAVALHRIAFGLFLIVAFSVGLAAVLITIGLLMVYAGRYMSRLQGEGLLITRWLPLGSAAVITILGVAITVQSLIAGGVLQVRV
ncbi:MAG TPA: sulfite exporter TauE/SafE family protein [Terriglobia bacterium]|nr:sulfite exporter TauE/SafE family protein [Terriglobia bacterium]